MPKKSSSKNTKGMKLDGINKYFSVNFIKDKLRKPSFNLSLMPLWNLLICLWNLSARNAVKYITYKNEVSEEAGQKITQTKKRKTNNTQTSKFKLGSWIASTTSVISKFLLKPPTSESDKCILKGKKKTKSPKEANKRNTKSASHFKLGSGIASTDLTITKNDLTPPPVTESRKFVLKRQKKSKSPNKKDNCMKKNPTNISPFQLGLQSCLAVKNNDFKHSATESDNFVLKGSEKNSESPKKENSLNDTHPRIKLETMVLIDPLEIQLEFQKRSSSPFHTVQHIKNKSKKIFRNK